MFNTEQRDWQDDAIAAINTGLSIATNPFLHWPDFSSQADERNHTNKGDHFPQRLCCGGRTHASLSA